FFTRYLAEIVPQLWLLTRKAQSRIFQQIAVPDILKQVLTGLSVDYELQGTYKPRDYCVQYRETDFNFASRLMEEEGIYYFFTHADGSHKMVVADTPMSHPDVPGATTAIYEVVEGGLRNEDRVQTWQKSQEIRSGKYTLRDQCFELPGQNLEAVKPTLDSVQVGTVSHKLKVAGNDKLELYDYPGGYAQRFDGVTPGGGDRASDIQNIFQDNERTVGLRMQQETTPALSITGKSTCRQFSAGHKFTLDRHFNANGVYVLTQVGHFATMGDTYTSGSDTSQIYENTFECIPSALPFRPARTTPRPTVEGTQTAVVVGSLPVEQIFTDKYGRVKVQFFWDRKGKFDADSSCWIRVATAWAGKGWGQINIPRIGHEVIVDFLEGDPDQPIIVGSVYNAENMPSKKLPEGKKTSGLVTRTNDPSVPGFNQMTCDDSDGKEMITIHGQYDMSTTIEHDQTLLVKNDRTDTVQGKHTETITKDTTITIVQGPYSHDVADNTATYHVSGDLTENYDSNQKTTVGDTQSTTVKNKITIGSTDADIEINGKTQIKLISGGSSIVLKADGTIQISGKEITVSGTAKVQSGVGNQCVTCDPAQVAVSGAAIASSATGKHEITGAVVKIN
ncbi:MAG: type VI secretion system Vgr family protein, partial [Isosphaeraceae bacterium]